MVSRRLMATPHCRAVDLSRRGRGKQSEAAANPAAEAVTDATSRDASSDVAETGHAAPRAAKNLTWRRRSVRDIVEQSIWTTTWEAEKAGRSARDAAALEDQGTWPSRRQ